MPSPSIRLALRIASFCGIAMMTPPPAIANDDGRGPAPSSSSRSFDGEDHRGRSSGSVVVGGSFQDGPEGGDSLSGSERVSSSSRLRRDGARSDPRDRYDRRGRDGRHDGFGRRGFDGGSSFLRAGRDRRVHYDGRHDDRRSERTGRRDGYGRTLTTFDVGDWGGGSVIYYGTPPAGGADMAAGLGAGGPRIIDIAAERLDRRPIGSSGIDIVETGRAKIIRIAPGYGMADAPRRSPSRRTADAPSAGLQPWSSGWLAYCTQAYRSFDADLGTYVAKDGRIRFCSAE